jgi:hypothetical protein
MKNIFCLLFVWALPLCIQAQKKPVFIKLAPDSSGVLFSNRLTETPDLNIITYEYFYNGGGVAVADFNNDGLTDLFFTGNLVPNKMYLNKGGLQFQDITRQSNTGGRRGWKTGVTIADVNGDGFVDIYVCYSGDVDSSLRTNQLLINNGNLTFTDKAKEYGLDDKSYSSHAAFFDMDHDGDLDMFLLNHNIKNLRNFDAAFVKKMVDPEAGDKLYENIGNKFIDISRKAGIISNPLGYGLGLNIADINNDGWPDIYVSNDYIEEDYLYLNNKNGSFTESLRSAFGHLSNFSMGVDIADINNDGRADIYTLDMLPEDNRRQKLLYAPDNYELYNNMLENGFYHQIMRNMLQLNNGDGTFSEIGQLANISNTDWSWSALLADFNNDGSKDLFVTNGYGRDVTSRDFMKFYADERLKFNQGKTDDKMFSMLQAIQATPLHNYIFENTDSLSFIDRSKDWGIDELGFSNGAAYADLDNDGDLDIIVNNLNQAASIYKNTTIENKGQGNYLKIQLKGKGKNVQTLGAKLFLYTGKKIYTQENFYVHGFQSAMQAPLLFHFNESSLDSLKIVWPDGQYTTYDAHLFLNKEIILNEVDASKKPLQFIQKTTVFTKPTQSIPFIHQEDLVNDFKIQPLIPNMLSYSGPKITSGDINNDQISDVYITGARGQEGGIFVQLASGDFFKYAKFSAKEDVEHEETDAVFFDADLDGDQDLYIVSGGYALEGEELLLQDRLYLNEDGNFTKRTDLIPKEALSGSMVLPLDFDLDGDLDLFIGTRVSPGKYPLSEKSMLLVNDGKGKFYQDSIINNGLLNALGMVTDALWVDINKDGNWELIVAAEWSNLRAFQFTAKGMVETTQQVFKDSLFGWWNKLHLVDVDNDGDQDLVAGNWGLNAQIKGNKERPVSLYYSDFDKNGYLDPILTYFIQDKEYPMPSRDEITDQMTSLRQKFPTYDAYANAGMKDIFTKEQLDNSNVLKANYMATTWFENKAGVLHTKTLPIEANFAPIHAIISDDFNKDGFMDLFLGGNIEQVRIKIGKMDANYGTLLWGDGKGNFTTASQDQLGWSIKGCIRDVIKIKNKNKQSMLLMGINNSSPLLYTY